MARAKLSRSASVTEDHLQEKIREGAKKFYLSRRSRSVQVGLAGEKETTDGPSRLPRLREVVRLKFSYRDTIN